MQKKMKLITTGGILGVFVLWNYIFEWLSKIGASIVSAVLSEQLPAEAWNSQLYGAIAKQSVPFVLMMILGAALIYWSRSKDKALAVENAEWAESAEQRRTMGLASAGGILAAVAVFAIFLPTYMSFQDLVMAFSSPEGVDYIMKMMVPNYVVLLSQLILGLWMVFGIKEKAAAVNDVQEEVGEEEGECTDADCPCNHSDTTDQPNEAADAGEMGAEEENTVEKSE